MVKYLRLPLQWPSSLFEKAADLFTTILRSDTFCKKKVCVDVFETYLQVCSRQPPATALKRTASGENGAEALGAAGSSHVVLVGECGVRGGKREDGAGLAFSNEGNRSDS
jgi:hypothetical protein